jgi:hypothetical protein
MTGRFDTYGPPSVELSAFRLWVHGREYPEATDSIDGNFLRITAHCAEKGASVVTTGSLLDTVSFVTFSTALQGLYDRLEGVAVLESHEPELRVTVNACGPTGRMEVRVEITPDHVNQAHSFEFVVDQSYLPKVVHQCAKVLGEYPVR